jgi:KDO2-lipid IV(A) lauroyltransferase
MASLQHHLEYFATRGVMLGLGRVPASWRGPVARGMGGLARAIVKRNVRVATENIRRAYGEAFPAGDTERLIEGTFEHFGLFILECARMLKMHAPDVQRIVDTSEAQPIFERLRQDRPVVCIVPHYGNWEMLGLSMAAECPAASMARPLDNPYLDKLINRLRSRTGQVIVSKHGGLRELLRYIKLPAMTGQLCDQDAGKSGVWAPLFGVPASTAPTAVQIALRWKLPLALVTIRRNPDGETHRALVRGPLDMENTGDTKRDIRVGLARCNRMVEDVVLECPEQWFGWLHRRWKTRPPDGESIFDAEGNPVEVT